MSARFPVGRLLVVVAFLLCLIGAVVGAVLTQPKAGEGDLRIAHIETPSQEILAESGAFRGLSQPSRFAEVSVQGKERTLATFNARRAFPGAPPIIPHAIESDVKDLGQNCLGCHLDGGYVRKFEAFAPVAPHPEYANCRQCHVVQPGEGLFAEQEWQRLEVAYERYQALPTSPPTIPHSLGMRENCLACHAGPGAVKEIRTTHPDRVNCRQCHVPAVNRDELTAFQRDVL